MASKPEQEPSIEEILASIRQIISDDDKPREADIDLSEINDKPDSFSASRKEDTNSSFADVLDLTNEIHEEALYAEAEDDTSFTIPVPEPELSKPNEPASSPISQPQQAAPREAITPFPPQTAQSSTVDEGDQIFSNVAAEATTSAFSRLMGNIPVEREENRSAYANGRVTLEDITRELLKPILRDWVNSNVPALVERLVEKELEKLARQARDE